ALIAAAAAPVRDHAAGRLDDRYQRVYIVGLESVLDDHIDESHRELRIAIAVAAIAQETRASRDRLQRGLLRRRLELARVRGRDDRVLDPRARARAQRAPLIKAPPLRGPTRGGHEGLADERLMDNADHGRRAVVQRDQDGPVMLAEDEALGAVDRIDYPGQRRAARFA